MLAYRLCRAPFAPLDGEGARLYGGRWNSPGFAVVYASSSRALAALEYLAHIDVNNAPDDLVLLTIDIPDDATRDRVDVAELSGSAMRVPNASQCRTIGDAWASTSRSLVMQVPAVPVPEETNTLLNPRHPAMADVRVTAQRPFAFDERLVAAVATSTSRRSRSRTSGFTLIEILVVVVVIGILAAFVAPAVFKWLAPARDTAARNQIEAFGAALDSYRLENGSYPSTQDGLDALWKKPANAPSWRGPYTRKAIPLDPWGHPYAYTSPGQMNPTAYDLVSYGRDGRPGGTGEDADINSWDSRR